MKFVNELRLWLITINFYCQKLWYYIDISRLVDYVPLGDPIFNRPQYRPNDRLSGKNHSIVARIALIGFWEVLKRIIKGP